MFCYPNKYLLKCSYPGVGSFFKALQEKDLYTAIYSDYPAVDKLKAMNLQADLVVSSTDADIDRLKPDPTAVLHIANYFKVNTNECLFIGDRHELDAQCAINAGSPYFIIDKKPYAKFDFYTNLKLKILQFNL